MTPEAGLSFFKLPELGELTLISFAHPNYEELRFIMKLLDHFCVCVGKGNPINIGIVAFYRMQVIELRKAIKIANYSKNISIQVSTVDGFQGREKDVSLFYVFG